MRERRLAASLGERTGEQLGVGLVGIFGECRRQFFGGDFGEPVSGGRRAGRVEAQVERAVGFKGEAALGVVDLHRGNAEVGEEGVGAVQPELGQHFRQAGEVGADCGEDVFAPTGGAQAGDGFRLFDGIDVESDEAAARRDTGQQFPGMSAKAEGAIDGEFAGLEREDFENFGHHDGPVRARRRLA